MVLPFIDAAFPPPKTLLACVFDSVNDKAMFVFPDCPIGA